MKLYKMAGNVVKPGILPEKPVDNLKFIAYKKIVDNYETAESLIKSKKPVLGEPIVVPFYYPSADDENRTIELAFGIGGASVETPYIVSSINNYIGDEIRITDETSPTGYISLRDKLNNLSDEVFDKVVNDVLNDPDFLNQLADLILSNSDKIDEAVQRKLDERFVWKPLSELL